MIKGLHFAFVKRPKNTYWYVYAWRGGPLIMKATGRAKPSLTMDALEAYRAAMADNRAVKPDTLASIMREFRGDGLPDAEKPREWTRLAESTKRQWLNRHDLIETKWGKTPISVWSDARMVADVVAWRDSASATPREADNRITILSAILEYARLRGKVKINVCAGIPNLYEGGNRAEILWTPEDIAAFAAKCVELKRPQVNDGLRLACHTGLRRADLVALCWHHVGTTAIVITAEKKSKGKRRKAVVPITQALRELLDELRTRERAPGVDNVLVNASGKAWSGDGFGNSIIRIRDDCGIVHDDGREKHLHDCRGTFATHLIIAGFTDQEAANTLGWTAERVGNIRRVYVDSEKVVVALADKLNAMQNGDRAVKQVLNNGIG